MRVGERHRHSMCAVGEVLSGGISAPWIYPDEYTNTQCVVASVLIVRCDLRMMRKPRRQRGNATAEESEAVLSGQWTVHRNSNVADSHSAR